VLSTKDINLIKRHALILKENGEVLRSFINLALNMQEDGRRRGKSNLAGGEMRFEDGDI
jgi:hypothetical protein